MNNFNKYSEQLILFLEQADTGNLKTKHFRRHFNNVKVKVSFGQGVSARIPWISFLKEPFTTSEGIYPVYLFYKSDKKLVLAYGISETHKPQKNWKTSNPIMIKNYFRENGISKPDRYGNSLIFKIYDTDNLPANEILDDDLNKIIEQYEAIDIKTDALAVNQRDLNISSFHHDCINANLKLSTHLITRYISSLVTKPFVLLTGLSGSGKTKLAEAFSRWITESKNQYCMAAVGADWTNREPLLGFPNALDTGKYIRPDSGVLDLILNAIEDPSKPYFLILDEMNMSHVERYFADFLSAMESADRSVSLRPDSKDWIDCDVPATISLPQNLFIIGTVNIDETTYMFSPKVLDRANVIEFRVSENEMESYFKSPNPLDMNLLRGQGVSMGESFVANSNKSSILSDNLGDTLMPFFTKLQEVGAEFGYRTASELSRFVAMCKEIAGDNMSDDEVIDAAIIQKLLPKLHGSRNKIEKVLLALGSLCLKDPENTAFEMNDDKSDDKYDVKFALSYEKLKRMHKSVVSDGFTSFAEA
jgi:5-methylcytosine-specific restriction protein B